MTDKTTHVFHSPFNKTIELVPENASYTLLVGGYIQSGTLMEKIWKETFKSLLPKLKAKNVLILGLGAGSIIPIIRKANQNSSIIGVEIDEVIIKIAQDYFPENLHNIEIKVDDAIQFVNKLVKKKQKGPIFDLIVVDCYIGDKQPEDTKTLKFLVSLKTIGKTVLVNQLFLPNNPSELKKISFLKQLDKYYPAKILKLPYNIIIKY